MLHKSKDKTIANTGSTCHTIPRKRRMKSIWNVFQKEFASSEGNVPNMPGSIFEARQYFCSYCMECEMLIFSILEVKKTTRII